MGRKWEGDDLVAQVRADHDDGAAEVVARFLASGGSPPAKPARARKAPAKAVRAVGRSAAYRGYRGPRMRSPR
jgi:hypothetical protein